MTLTSDPRTGTAPGAAERLAAVATRIFGGDLPLRIRAWDGSAAGPDDAPTVVVRDPAALRRLVSARLLRDTPSPIACLLCSRV